MTALPLAPEVPTVDRAQLTALPILPLADVARLLALPFSTLEKLCSKGEGPHCCRIGRRLYVRQGDLQQWLQGLPAAKPEAEPVAVPAPASTRHRTRHAHA